MVVAPDFQTDGFEILRSVASATELNPLKSQFDPALPGERRFSANGFLGEIIERGELWRVAASRLGERVRPVRLILFDKNEERNWTLGWHQDRVIAVKERAELAGFANWSRKWGAMHVEPPFEIIQRMITVRLHCDDCSAENGALEVISGSHRLGKLDDAQTREAVEQGEPVMLECSAGDAVLLSTSILHRSAASRNPARRRVLHVDYSADALPAPLAWAYLQRAISTP